jgi:Undecaprenyl-phosphate galactose phosphotransferase WbaP
MFDEERSGPVWFTPLHLVEHLGLEVTHNLLDPLQKSVKRLLDLTLIFVAAPLLAPFVVVLAILIKLDSVGPILYSQKRVGFDGKEITIWKFRSMSSNAKEELAQLLEQDPSSKREWEENFKLKNDPRVTRFGDILRRTSLDELPQIWNILRGEMSMIGPRPIVQDEIPLYGKEFEIYKQVLPGLTGMWQISGRNDLPYRERVNLDIYYVQNWSIWLDIHILMHTVWTVLEGRGAY